MKEPHPIEELSLSELASLVEASERPASSGRGAYLVRCADLLTRRSHDRLIELVVAARAEGMSWRAIGDALGISRQGAFKRFAEVVDSSPERKTMSEQTVDLITRTHAVFESLNAEDYEAVRADMTYNCARSLNKRKVMAVWDQVVIDSGQLRGCTDSVVQISDGMNGLSRAVNRLLANGAIVQTTLQHENGEWLGRVAYNGSGKITGLLIAPPGSRDLSF